MTSSSRARYKRILLKLSGEALCGASEAFGVDATTLKGLVLSIQSVKDLGVEIAIVVGGGNFFRGQNLTKQGFDRFTSDQMGMLSTVMNGLALRQAFNDVGIASVLMSTLSIPGLVDIYDRHEACQNLKNGRVVIFTGGVGTPLFTTDTAASLRAIDIGADILLKASTIDAVYSEDPKKNPDAKRYDHLSYQDVIDNRLGVMDITAFLLCQEHCLPIRVFNAEVSGILKAIVKGDSIGTLISNGDK